ncbi:MAG: nitrilase [Planctomycetes bacterium RBG_13_63_9]|nr:MAG: nitrilase [Planctomycetes bacterium RBG_13_63_9]
MSSTDRFYAAACQLDMPNPTHRDQIAGRVKRMLEMIDHAVTGYEPFFDVRLVVFPEFAHAAPIYPTVEELLDRLALPIPNEHTDQYRGIAKRLGVYVQTGTFLESDARWGGHVFNTTCLIGPDGLLARYRKVHPWIPWEVHTSPHDLADYDEPMFPVTETEIGRIGAAICYDWLFPEAIRQLGLGGAEVLVRVSAYMDPWGTAPPLDWWTSINRVRAIENMAYVVAANQAASLQNYPPFSWPGGSMIVDYDGRVLAQADPGPGEKIVVGPIDLAALRAERGRRRGHHLLAHLRTEAYPMGQEPIYPAGRGSQQTISVELNETSTRQAREALKRISGDRR